MIPNPKKPNLKNIPLAFLSTLKNANQRGGAYLRVLAIEQVYRKIGLDPTLYYQESFETKYDLSGIKNLCLYGKDTRILFKKNKDPLPQAELLHLDSYRQFSWNYSKSSTIIYNAHNLEFENYFGRNLDSRGERFKKLEFKTLENAKCIWVCSQREKVIAEASNKNLRNKIYVIPNLVDSQQYRSSEKQNKIVFIGTLDYLPNVKAIDFLMDHFFQRIPSAIKAKYEFIIAGRNPDSNLMSRCQNAGITFLPNLSQQEMLKLYSQSKLLLAPITHGSGTRLKITEAIFSNCHVLATPLGAEGLESDLINISSLENFTNTFLKMIKEKKLDQPLSSLDLKEYYTKNDLSTWINNHHEEIRKAVFE